MKASESLELVSKVHGLYQSAFSDFVVLVGVVVGVTGVLLPIFITVAQFLQQKRETKIAHEKLDALVSTAVEAVESRLRQDNAKALEAFATRSEDQLKRSKEELEKKLRRLEAATLHVQAQGLLRSEDYLEAAKSAKGAIPGYIGSHDHLNLRRVIDGVLCPCLRKMDSGYFKNAGSLEASIRDSMKSIRGADTSGAFTDLLDELERDLSDAIVRTRAEED